MHAVAVQTAIAVLLIGIYRTFLWRPHSHPAYLLDFYCYRPPDRWAHHAVSSQPDITWLRFYDIRLPCTPELSHKCMPCCKASETIQ